MSMYLEFEPHSWYMGAAIQKLEVANEITGGVAGGIWCGYYLNGMTGYIVDFSSLTLKELKQQIKEYVNKENERVKRLYKAV